MSINIYAQEIKQAKNKLFVGYFGETISHYGLTAGVEHYAFQNEKYQIILSANAGAYVHIRNNSSIFLRTQWGQRYTSKSGVFVDNFLGLGYLHQFTNGGEIYEVLPNGAVVETPNTGKAMVMPSISIGTGYDFSKKTKSNLIFYVRPELFWKAPFNGYYLTHFAINTGLIFKLNAKNEK